MQSTRPLSATSLTLFNFFVAGMAVVYLVNCFTPLHIHVDTIRYYNIKDCLEFGCPPNSFAATDYLPYGYTSLLILLSKLGILKSFSIIFINCLYLLGGLYFVNRIFNKYVPWPLLTAVILFNWVLIKFVMFPLSEMQFIFFSGACLYSFHIYKQNRRLLYLGISVICCLLAILTRTVGIALVPALVMGLAWERRDSLLRILKKNKVFIPILAALVVVVVFMKQLKIVDYTSLLKESLKDGLWSFVGTNFQNHFTELTEVFLNIPSKKVFNYVPETTGTPLFVAVGVLLFVWFMYVIFSRKSVIPFYIRVYLLCYALIIINWPYYDPRFWVPVLPLIAAVVLQMLMKADGFMKAIRRIWFIGYMSLGAIAALYSLYIGFNKERFSQNQANGVYRNEYEIHFFGKPVSDTAVHKDQNVIDILNKYD